MKSASATQTGDTLCTLQEIADEFGVSRERVRQLEQSALKKCLAYCRRNNLDLDDLLPDGYAIEWEAEDIKEKPTATEPLVRCFDWESEMIVTLRQSDYHEALKNGEVADLNGTEFKRYLNLMEKVGEN